MKLAVLKRLQDPSIVTISRLPYTIGRSRSADFIIAQVNVSRSHCEIVKENEQWKINDHSSSGTFVNDVLIGRGKSVLLNNGDSIRFGPAENNLCWSFYHENEDGLTESNPKPVKQVNETETKLKETESENQKHPEESTNEDDKIKQLTNELKQVQNALNDLEEKNCALKGELAETSTKPQQSNLLENIADLMETEFQCTICSELFVTAVMLSCSHTFCKYCIDQWKTKQKTCPICRKKITMETRSLVVDNYIDKMVENLSVELKERRQVLIKERTEFEPVSKKSRTKNKNSKR